LPVIGWFEAVLGLDLPSIQYPKRGVDWAMKQP